MGESLKPHHGEMHNIEHLEGSRRIEVGPDISYADAQVIQASLALHEWCKKHADETRHVDFVNPRDSEKSLRADAMREWEGDLGGETLRGRCRAFLDSLETTGLSAGVFDLSQAADRERLLARIKEETGEDPASKETIH